MSYVIPDRMEVARLKYQLRRFRKACAELPADTQARVEMEMYGLLQLLSEQREDDTRCDEGDD
ncbi:hypothetical protein D3C80_1009090 [compost metagenome]